MKLVKIILFDADGVLIRSNNWSSEFTKRYHLPEWAMRGFFAGIFQDCATGKADLKSILPPFLKDWKWDWSVDDFLYEWFQFENKPDTELISKIQELRKEGINCYVATNQEKYRLEFLRNEMKFSEYFDGIFCSAEIGLKKPQKEYFDYILKSLEISPDKVVYFDDSAENIDVASGLWIQARLYRDISDFHID